MDMDPVRGLFWVGVALGVILSSTILVTLWLVLR